MTDTEATNADAMSTTADQPSAWAPLRHRLFRALWVASVVSNLGTWMEEVGEAWLMTDQTASPLLVSLLQTADSLPIFLLALPAGALADIVDRRRLLLFTQGWMCVAAATLGVLTLLGLTTPWVLLTFTCALGVGTALNVPAWQALTPELVSREELPAAAALGGVGFNIARSVGPALGGLIVAAAGPGAVFLLNAASFVGVIVVLYRWRRAPRQSVLPTERVAGAVRAGLRYVHYAPPLRAVLIRTLAFIVCGSALWGLLPVVGRRELKLTSVGYGVLLGCLGLGAVFGATALPGLRRRVPTDALVAVATILWAGVMAAFAFVQEVPVLCVLLLVGGMGWITLMSSLNVAAQTSVPSWVRGRALALYVLAFQGGMAAGSALWGSVATHASIPVALIAAATGLVLGLLTIAVYRLPQAEAADLSPSMHWPAPVVSNEPEAERGPVLVTVEYHIDSAHAEEFARAASGLRSIRRRDGAVNWGLFQDLADPSRWVETFVVETWAEHLRQHERVTVEDRHVEDAVRAFQVGGEQPVVKHHIAGDFQEG
jgi:MFS family permease